MFLQVRLQIINFTIIIDHTRSFNKAGEEAALLTSCGENKSGRQKLHVGKMQNYQ